MPELRQHQRLQLNEAGCMASPIFARGVRDARLGRRVSRRERNASALLWPSLSEEP
jgi:hypothetical protein